MWDQVSFWGFPATCAILFSIIHPRNKSIMKVLDPMGVMGLCCNCSTVYAGSLQAIPWLLTPSFVLYSLIRSLFVLYNQKSNKKFQNPKIHFFWKIWKALQNSVVLTVADLCTISQYSQKSTKNPEIHFGKPPKIRLFWHQRISGSSLRCHPFFCDGQMRTESRNWVF